MFKLKTRKGYILIEILCAMTIFTMLVASSIAVFYQSRKIKKIKNDNLNCFIFAEGLKNNIMYNSNYEDLCYLRENNKLYITKENMNLDKLKNKDILEIFKNDFKEDTPYIKLDIKGQDILKINMKLYSNEKNKLKAVCCEFYKGRYKR